MTLDGFCDHTAMIADDEIHRHFTGLLQSADTILYGRTTYQLMESYWPTVVANPTGNPAADEFAVTIDDVPKIVYSRTLNEVHWKKVTLKKTIVKEEIEELKQQSGKNILAGSPSLIVALTNLNLVDEYQLVIHPVIAGTGLPLFKNITERIKLKLLKTKIFGAGQIALYYEPSTHRD